MFTADLFLCKKGTNNSPEAICLSDLCDILGAFMPEESCITVNLTAFWQWHIL